MLGRNRLQTEVGSSFKPFNRNFSRAQNTRVPEEENLKKDHAHD